MANNAHIDILALNKTKEGWDDAIKTAVNSSKKIESSVSSAGSSAAGVADKIGHTGEVASKMAINLLQAFGLSGDKAKALEGILRQVDDGFDALGKAAQLATVANTAVAASNVAVGTTAAGATTATAALTAIIAANPLGAILVGIAAAATAVYAAFQLWPDSEDHIKGVNNKLEDQVYLLNILLEKARERIKVADTMNTIEKEMIQKQEIATIKGIQNVETAKEQAKITAEMADEQIKKNKAVQDEIDFLTQKLETEKKIYAEKQKQTMIVPGLMTGGKADMGDLGAQMMETQEKLEKQLVKQMGIKKNIANLEEQTRAAAERALEIPKEEEKIKEENDKKQAKREEDSAKKREKFAADRLKAEDDYADAVRLTAEEIKKADDDREKAWEKEHEEIKKKAKEKVESFRPSFVGLEDLTRGIQMTAMGATKKDREEAAANQAAVDTHEILKRCEKVWGDTARADEETAVRSKEMAEKIDKMGALA